MTQQSEKVSIAGKSLEDCLERASKTLGVPRDRLGYQVVRGTSNSLMSFFLGKRFEIEAWPKKGGGAGLTSQDMRAQESDGGSRPPSRGPRETGEGRRGSRRQRGSRHSRSGGNRDGTSESRGFRGDRGRGGSRGSSNSSESRPDGPRTHQVREKIELDEAQTSALVSQLGALWQELCTRLTQDEKVQVSSELQGDGRLVFKVDHPFFRETQDPGRLGSALETILRRSTKIRQELPFRIFVDLNGERSDLEQKLAGVAKSLSERVHADQKPVVLASRSAYERRIIHMTLAEDPRVYTKSIGSGSRRKLMIAPKGIEEFADPPEEIRELSL